MRNGKSTAGHQRYLAHCRKNMATAVPLTPLLNPVRTRKSLIWP
ncbi:hypothetical protein M8494_05290 [Serratia ureilytica]